MTTLVPVIEGREGWGMASTALGPVLRPERVEDVLEAYALAQREGWRVSAWGNGRSYGDAALNDSNLLLDFGAMNRILEWDPTSGVIKVQPGLTLQALWQHVLPHGWWPPVVTGTMFTTLGGMAAANAHGKNNAKAGPIGDHILAFELVDPTGHHREVTRESDPELFHAAIGGFGWLGHFTSITLQMKRVYSGRLQVIPEARRNLGEMFESFERHNGADMDYCVGWIDAFPGGASLGRGQIHAARYLAEGEDPEGRAWLSLPAQEQPTKLFGVVPKRWAWWLAKPFAHRLGMRAINLGRYAWMAARPGAEHAHLESHAGFNFLLDFVPNWKWFYKPGGLIQYQFFLPRESAQPVFRQALEMARAARQESWLVVMKRHRPDAFWLSHALDGYSFACDHRVTDRNRGALFDLTRQFEELVVEAGGRFYFAKDSVVSGEAVRRSLGDDVLGRFFALKSRTDPQDLLGGNQYRRLFGVVRGAVEAARGTDGVAAG